MVKGLCREIFMGTLLFAALPTFAAQATLYVSSTGSGTAFSEAQPGALPDVIAKIKSVNAAMTGDIMVQMAGGWYALSSTLAFDAACSGTNGYNVIFAGAPGEYPVISGGKRITGWTLHDQVKNIYVATAPSGITNRQMYVNCVRAIRARKGNQYDPVNGLPMPRGCGFSGNTLNASAQDIAAATGSPATDQELVYTGGAGGLQQWQERRAPVTSISVSGTSISFSASGGGSTALDWENAYGLIDQAGEFYVDMSANKVYYKPRTGEDMATAVVVSPCLEKLATFTGTSNVQFFDVTFAHGTWLSPNNSAYSSSQAGQSGTILGNVQLTSAQNLRFERCVFKHLGGRGIFMEPGCKNNTVIGCLFTQISGSAVQIGTTAGGTGSAANTSGNKICNCYIHDGAAEFHDQPAVFVGYTEKTAVTHCFIDRTYYSGISIGWGWGRGDAANQNNNEVSYIHWKDIMPGDAGPILGDGGPIYTLGNMSGSIIHHNYCQNLGCNSPGALYNDEGSGNIELYQNLLVNVCTWLSWWTSSIHDNNAHDNFTTTSSMDNSGTNCTVSNTTLIGAAESSWPAGAVAIKNAAGLEPAFAFVKDMKCACSGGGSSFDPNRPYLIISPNAITLAAEKGTAAASQTIAVTNGRGGTLSAITANIVYGPGATDWITIVKGGSGNTQSIALQFATSAFNIGIYSATLVVSATGALPVSVECPIEIKVDGDRDPDNPQGAVAGLNYKYYEGTWSNVPNFSALTPVKTGTCTGFDIGLANRTDNYALSFTGYVQAPTTANYTFSTESDDGSMLYFGNLLVVNNDGNHGVIAASGQIRLKAGLHAIRVDFFQGGGGQSLVVKLNGQAIAAGSLFRTPQTTALHRPFSVVSEPQQAVAAYTICGQRVNSMSSLHEQSRCQDGAAGVFVTVRENPGTCVAKRAIVVR